MTQGDAESILIH